MDKQASFNFPDEPPPTRLREPPIKVKATRESKSLCAYCGCMVPTWALDHTPQLSDTAQWTAITSYHGKHCRWIETRGLRLERTEPDGIRHGAQRPAPGKV